MGENVGEQFLSGGSLSGRNFFPTWHKHGNARPTGLGMCALVLSRLHLFSDKSVSARASWDQALQQHPCAPRDKQEGKGAEQRRSGTRLGKVPAIPTLKWGAGLSHARPSYCRAGGPAGPSSHHLHELPAGDRGLGCLLETICQGWMRPALRVPSQYPCPGRADVPSRMF